MSSKKETDLLEVCLQNTQEILHACNLNAASDWSNVGLTVLATVIAGFSAWCAWHANRSSKQQASREHFDRACGDKFFEQLKEVRSKFNPIKSRLVRSANLSDDEIDNFKTSIQHIRTLVGKLFTEALSMDEYHDVKSPEKLQGLVDTVLEKLTALIGFIDSQEDNWHNRANSCVDDVESGCAKIQKKFFDLRSKHKM